MKDLVIKDLCVTYHPSRRSVVYAVDHVSFSIKQGESLGIIGESGSGKSTLNNAILRILPKSTEVNGEIFYGEEDLLKCSENRLKDLRWEEISVVFQKSMNNLSPVHKIGDQFEEVYRVHNKNATKEEIRSKVFSLFKKVNLPERVYDSYPHMLSGGMLQRLSIVLSLLDDPSLLIMDEATTALDVVTQGQILDEILKMEQEAKITRIMITHDLSVVATSCRKIMVMYAGRLMEFGTVRDIIEHPLHPYTQGLIRSFPSLYGKKEELKSIPGSFPNLSEKHEGCIFANRCPFSNHRCLSERPVEKQFNSGHFVACHRAGDVVYE